MENRYTDSVKNAWKFAAEEASKLGSEYVGTEVFQMKKTVWAERF